MNTYVEQCSRTSFVFHGLAAQIAKLNFWDPTKKQIEGYELIGNEPTYAWITCVVLRRRHRPRRQHVYLYDNPGPCGYLWGLPGYENNLKSLVHDMLKR